MGKIDSTLRTIIDEHNARFFERRSVIEAIVISLLARKHPFLLGPPGTSKSMLIRSLCDSIDGANYWETLFDKQLGKEDIFGPIDMVAFDKQNLWHRKVDGYLPTAHIAFGDEFFKAGPAVLNPLLTALNEFKYHGNSSPMDIPLLMFAAASNEMPEGEELGALWDRLHMRVVVDYIREDKHIDALFDMAAGQFAPATAPRTTIDLNDLLHAITVEVPGIVLPQGIKDALRQLKNQMAHPADGSPRVVVSDRRWYQTVSILQASAYLNGRSAIDDDDLVVLRHVLWETPALIPVVEKQVYGLASPQTAKAIEITEVVDEMTAHTASLRGSAVNERAQYGAEVNNKVRLMLKEIEDLKQEALATGRSTTRLDEVEGRVLDLRRTVLHELLNVPQESLASI